MKRISVIVVTLIILSSASVAQDSFFPIAAVLGNGKVPFLQLLDTVKTAGFNMTWMGGFKTSDSLTNLLVEYKQKGLKAVVHYPVHPSNISKYNTERFASAVHYMYQPESDSFFNKGSTYGHAEGQYWVSANRCTMLFWDSANIFRENNRRWLYRNATEHRMPMRDISC